MIIPKVIPTVLPAKAPFLYPVYKIIIMVIKFFILIPYIFSSLRPDNTKAKVINMLISLSLVPNLTNFEFMP